jgi:hypothetical protein
MKIRDKVIVNCYGHTYCVLIENITKYGIRGRYICMFDVENRSFTGVSGEFTWEEMDAFYKVND